MADRTRILFLCTGNSARSIMAEAIANGLFADRLEASSAGSRPKGTPHPLALRTIERRGLDPGGLRSKSWEEVGSRPFDLVVTLCDGAARESCPRLPGAPATAHWGFPDPPAADDPERAFETVFDALREAVRRLVDDEDGDPASRAARVGTWVAARFPAG